VAGKVFVSTMRMNDREQLYTNEALATVKSPTSAQNEN